MSETPRPWMRQPSETVHEWVLRRVREAIFDEIIKANNDSSSNDFHYAWATENAFWEVADVLGVDPEVCRDVAGQAIRDANKAKKELVDA